MTTKCSVKTRKLQLHYRCLHNTPNYSLIPAQLFMHKLVLSDLKYDGWVLNCGLIAHCKEDSETLFES